MAAFSVGGLSSGIDYNELIARIVEVGRRPVAALEGRKSEYDVKIGLLGTLSSKLSALRSAAANLRTARDFYVKSAQASDAAVVDASAASSAAAGNYAVTVTTLAQTHRIASSGVASPADAVGGSGGNFSFRVGTGATTTVAVTAATTLSELRDAINAAGGDAQASIVHDGTSYRLVLASKASGAANAITVAENATTLGLPTGPVPGGTTLQAAQDASFAVDGLAMTSAANVVRDALEGVTLTLKTAGSATVSVTNDTAAIRKRIDEFVAAYNDVVGFVSANSGYDTAAKKGGPLVGDAASRDVILRLAAIVGTRVAGLPEDMRLLAQVGIRTGADGKLSVDGSTLDGKLASDLPGVAGLFASAGGIAVRVYDYAGLATDSTSGGIPLRKKGLEKLVSEVADDIRRIEERLDREEERLRKRFSALEALISGLSSQSAFLASLVPNR